MMYKPHAQWFCSHCNTFKNEGSFYEGEGFECNRCLIKRLWREGTLLVVLCVALFLSVWILHP
jgi:hypothetical protein